jgi:hypothetical protein
MSTRKWKSYTAYSIGCGIVWALIWVVIAVTGTSHSHAILLVFGGWVIGWTSATIARAVYPPPALDPDRAVRGAGH